MDWVATCCGLLGCFLVGQGYKVGWLCFCGASAINVYIGIEAGYLGMAVGGICYLVLELRGYKKHDEPKKL